MKYSTAVPAAVRALIREGELTGPTTGYCDGYAQGNLVVLPKVLAWDFLLFCQRNPKACPLLEVADAGERSFSRFAPGSDIARDIPRYRIYKNGVLAEETADVMRYFEERKDLVSFLIGCSFSFEAALLEAEKDLPHLDAGGMLINLLLDPGTLRTMSQMAHTCARPDAASKVAQGVLALCRQS